MVGDELVQQMYRVYEVSWPSEIERDHRKYLL